MAAEQSTEAPQGKDEAKERKTDKSGSSSGSGRARSSRPARAGEIAGNAARQLAELTGREPEGVTGLERTEDGWMVSIDVLELRRVPATADVLASYEVEVTGRGALRGYRRVGRYVRGSTSER